MRYDLVSRFPAVNDYRRLRVATGLSAKSVEAAEIGLQHTWFGVSIIDDAGHTVGMGRIVGDGGCFFQVVDIAVLPEHQAQGLGKRIMAALVEELEHNAPESAYVSLIADGDARFLYQSYGFQETAPASVGMYRRF